MNVASLEEIADEVKACTLCPLAEGRTNAVPGEGSGGSGLVFIGEAPGATEDAEGRPFVGRAGRILDEALKSTGLRREDVYITSVVKCRPPNNRRPHVGERRTCVEAHLHRQLEALNPKVICLLGNTAVQTMLGKRPLAEVAGKAVGKEEGLFFATYHPAAALYNRKLKATLHNHMGLLARLLRSPDDSSERALSSPVKRVRAGDLLLILGGRPPKDFKLMIKEPRHGTTHITAEFTEEYVDIHHTHEGPAGRKAYDSLLRMSIEEFGVFVEWAMGEVRQTFKAFNPEDSEFEGYEAFAVTLDIQKYLEENPPVFDFKRKQMTIFPGLEELDAQEISARCKPSDLKNLNYSWALLVREDDAILVPEWKGTKYYARMRDIVQLAVLVLGRLGYDIGEMTE